MSIMSNKLKITRELDIQFKDLCRAVDFEYPFTLGDIIHIVNSSSYISKNAMCELVNCNYIGEYLNEMNKPIEEIKDEFENDPKIDGKIEYLQINWVGDKSEYSDGIWMDSHWEFDGIGEKGFMSQAEERGFTEVDPEYRECYALEFTPVNKLANLEIKMCQKMQLKSREKDENYSDNKKFIFNDVKVLFTPDISLLDLLHAIFWELSMMGNPQKRDEEKNILAERVKKFKEQEANGTLVTVPWEEVRARLNKMIEDTKNKKKDVEPNFNPNFHDQSEDF